MNVLLSSFITSNLEYKNVGFTPCMNVIFIINVIRINVDCIYVLEMGNSTERNSHLRRALYNLNFLISVVFTSSLRTGNDS